MCECDRGEGLRGQPVGTGHQETALARPHLRRCLSRSLLLGGVPGMRRLLAGQCCHSVLASVHEAKASGKVRGVRWVEGQGRKMWELGVGGEG